jgi:hypothetical protein
MLLIIVIPLLLSLAAYFVPVFLHKRKEYTRADQFFVSVDGADGLLFQNASVAYALQMATLGPFFVWGFTGTLFPALLNTLFYCFGLLLIIVFRGPIIEFISQSLADKKSITIHQFIADKHGKSPSVRVVASMITIIALLGLVLGEMLGLSAVVQPFFGADKDIAYTFVVVIFFIMFLYTTTGGNDGVMHSDQLQLGFAYVGLFSIVFFLATYAIRMHGTSVGAIPVSGATMFIFAVLAILVLRRLVFLRPVNAADPSEASALRGKLTRLLRMGEFGLNVFVAASAIIAMMALAMFVMQYRSSAGSVFAFKLLSPSGTTVIMAVALAVLPLLYQVIDISNWQRLAAFVKGSGKNTSPYVRSLFRYAIEAPLTWVMLIALGAVAAVLPIRLDDPAPVSTFVSIMLNSGSKVLILALASFAVSVFGIALSTMDAVFAAALCAFRYDILPSLRENIGAVTEAEAKRASVGFGVGAFLFVVTLLFIGERYIGFGREKYLAILLGFYSGQIAFTPLIIGPLLLQKRMGARCYLSTATGNFLLIASLATGLACVGLGLWMGKDDLLWWSVPATMGLSTIIYVISVALSPSRTVLVAHETS